MNISELAVKPSLIKVTVDDEAIIEEYGEPLEFFVWDRQPIDKFIKFAGREIKPEDYGDLLDYCSDMILDEQGNPVLVDGKVLPGLVLSHCVTRVLERLGK